MPFQQQWSKAVWEDGIKAACTPLGVIPVRGDDIMGPNILADIWRAINTCRAFIADVTGANPNVMYELGLAHALKKDVILIAQHETDIPFDLRVYRHVLYTPDRKGIERLIDQLNAYLEELFFRGPDNFGKHIHQGEFVILFVSTGGTCRCAMANVVTRYLLSKDKTLEAIEAAQTGVRSISAGLFGQSEEFISHNAQTALFEKFGLQVAHHKTLRLTAPLRRRADIILAMDAALKKGIPSEVGSKVAVFSEFFGKSGDVKDPYGGSIQEYRKCLDQIHALLSSNIDVLAQRGK